MSPKPPRPQVGRPRKGDSLLGPDTIVAAARAIVDDQGLSAVTMRALATRLGCTPRALYRHVDHKQAVLELLADSALAELPEIRDDLAWRESLTEFFISFRNLLVARPEVALIIAGQTVTGVNFRRHADRAISKLLDAGFEAEIAVEAIVALAYYTLGASVPGAGQPLHDQWHRLEEQGGLSNFPTLAAVGGLFATDQAAKRFQRALNTLVAGYATALTQQKQPWP